MSKKETLDLVVVEAKKPSKFKTLATAVGAGATAIMLSTPAHAATLDLSGLTTELEGIKTAVVGVFATALLIGVAIVGWRWAKRALFSI